MRLYDKLPHFVYLNNEKYFINTDYRIFIKFEKDFQGKNDKKVIYNTLTSFYPDFFLILNKNLLEPAINCFLWLYRCGRTEDEISYDTRGVEKSGHNERIYDYEYDAELIYGAFYDRGIDLSKDRVHWWQFRALFKSLPDKCEFKKVMGYRSYDGDDKELLKLKELYKLPPTKFQVNERRRRDKIFDELNKISSQK